jgi:hypothetical protein
MWLEAFHLKQSEFRSCLVKNCFVVFISQGFGSSVMRNAAREWRHPVGMEAIPGFWIPAIHAGMMVF